jgi:hypothetical protein
VYVHLAHADTGRETLSSGASAKLDRCMMMTASGNRGCLFRSLVHPLGEGSEGFARTSELVYLEEPAVELREPALVEV